jgi:hypothetical protein
MRRRPRFCTPPTCCLPRGGDAIRRCAHCPSPYNRYPYLLSPYNRYPYLLSPYNRYPYLLSPYNGYDYLLSPYNRYPYLLSPYNRYPYLLSPYNRYPYSAMISLATRQDVAPELVVAVTCPTNTQCMCAGA